tara:strand:+ start:437 stop:1951 length:1515 start_codon:yes stop_codon:yes gene_type:complete
MNLINQISYPVIILIILLSILGYGYILDRILNLKSKSIDLKNILFIKGLIFSGTIGMVINFIFPISSQISILIIFLGLIIYIYYFIKNKYKKKEYSFIFFIVLISFIYSFYAGVNDDFDYHIKIINNYKNNNLFSIIHENRISYNPHWLFVNSIFSISLLSSSLFAISSILYSILIYDFYRLYKKSFSNKIAYTGIISFLILIFFIGVLNKYKEIGTDIPGVIISFYILLLIINNIFDKKQKISQEDVFTILLFSSFIFIIKITNSLIILFLIITIFHTQLKKLKLKYIFLPLVLPLLWFFQNYIISGCLIWPIEFSCFQNQELAKIETNIIEAFAKGDINISLSILNSFNWIKIWLQNHITKMIETYLLFFLIMTIPIFYSLVNIPKKKTNLWNEVLINVKNMNYLFLFSITTLANIIWFLNAPAYRFGIFYNLTLILLILLPFWKSIFTINFLFVKKFCSYVLILVVFYFGFENVRKVNWYFDRYESWPPIEKMEFVKRKKN